jgi:hypothetical protein
VSALQAAAGDVRPGETVEYLGKRFRVVQRQPGIHLVALYGADPDRDYLNLYYGETVTVLPD